MKHYDDTTYGQRIAEVYDELYSDFDPAAIDLLAELAGEGTALELGIGTGRIALPLHERGIRVHGIDASQAMLARLKAKPHGDHLPLHTGSFASFDLEQRFNLIYVVFNTFFALLTQEEQVTCFQSVGRHLIADGVFLIDAFVPDPCRFVDHQTMRVVGMGEDMLRFDASQYDPVTQQVVSQHVFLSPEGTRMFPVKLRFAWPSELDLMARLAGLSLRQRWGSWEKDPFNRESRRHISIFAPEKS
jgi:SAM-dependent methyltransferase